MQDNEFEKQVRDKLSGLNIDAGESVWDKVDERLHQKEKRRRWLIWIPLGLTGIILSAVILSQVGTHKTETLAQDRAILKERNTPAETKDKKISRDSIGSMTLDQKNDNTESHKAGPEALPPNDSPRDSGIRDSTKGQETSGLNRKSIGQETSGPNQKTVGQETSGLNRKTVGQETSRLNQKTVGQETSGLNRKTVGQETSGLKVTMQENSGQNKTIRDLKHSKARAKIFAKKSSQNADEFKSSPDKLANRKRNEQESGQPAVKIDHQETTISNLQKISATDNDKIHEKTSDRKEPAGVSDTLKISVTDKRSDLDNISAPEEIKASLLLPSSALNRSIAVTEATFNSPSIPPQKISKQHNHLTWGIEAAFGRSGITSGKLDNLFYSPASNVSNYQAINVGNNNSGAPQSPSQVRPGLAASLGVYIKLPLDEPLYFKAGLRYDLFTTSIKVGSEINQSVRLQSLDSRADKSIESYYTTGKNEQYINRYNFIDLPLAFGIQFAKYSRLPFAWELGIAPGIFVGSNALNYNQTSSIYYKDNSVFRKTQMQVFTAVPIQFLNRKAYALELAPGFNYMSSGLFKPELNEKKHLLSSGISLRARF